MAIRKMYDVTLNARIKTAIPPIPPRLEMAKKQMAKKE
jgi:hypothetical protein